MTDNELSSDGVIDVTKRSGIFERALVCFACASAALGLFSAFAMGLLVILLGNSLDIVLDLAGPRTTTWWLGALGVWFLLAGLVGLAMWHREKLRPVSSDRLPRSEGMDGA